MEKHRCKVKFEKNKIVCASAVQCTNCPNSNTCEDIDIFIEGKYQGISGCMTHDSHEKRNGKVIQKRWGRD